MKPSDAHSPSTRAAWDARYEVKAILLMFLGFGMVGLDRFIINPLFPVIQKDLGLDYQDLGLINGVLALGIGLSAILSGRVTDRVGYKRVLVVSTIVFSALVGFTGLATSLFALLVLRGLMGLAEGPYGPASIVATIRASRPTRIGLNVGLQQMALPLFGTGLAPLIAVGLLDVVPSWHWVFASVAIPGLIIAYLLSRVLVMKPGEGEATPARATAAVKWSDLLGNRVVLVNAACMVCLLACVLNMSAFMPSYMADHLQLPLADMAWVLSGHGIGGLLGMILIPALSDRFGRKRVMVIALLIEVAMLASIPAVGANLLPLFAVQCIAVMMNSGAIAIIGPLTNSAVPAALAGSAVGFVMGIGELLGGAVAPVVIGAVAQRHGIVVIPTIALIAIAVSLLVILVGMSKPVTGPIRTIGAD